MKQRKVFILAAVLLLLFIGAIYYYFFSKPSDFLGEAQLKEVVQDYFPGVEIKIQDVIFVDDTHVFVPFISDDRYGSSFWFWKNRKWELGNINTIQNPYVWKIDPNDTSSYKIFWNFYPKTEMRQFDIFLLKRRSYYVSNDVHQYIPRVHLKETIPFNNLEASYGVKSLPANWAKFLSSYLAVEKSKQPTTVFFDFIQPQSYYFGWNPLNAQGEVSYPHRYDGSGTGYGDIHLEFMPGISEYDELIK